MNDLISRQAAIMERRRGMICNCSMAGTAACSNCPTKQWTDEGRFPSKVFFAYGVDAVEVVRCGECKWYEEENDVDGYCDKNGLAIWDKDWFCADGERGTDEDDRC